MFQVANTPMGIPRIRQENDGNYCTVLTWAKSASPEPAAFELEAVLLLLVSSFGAILYNKNESVFFEVIYVKRVDKQGDNKVEDWPSFALLSGLL
jgi:hypothetical protein